MSDYPVTEYLAMDLEVDRWKCRNCDAELGEIGDPYKHGLLVRERDPRELHSSGYEQHPRLYPDPEWCRILEFICPSCATLIEVEYLPPGHPPTDDIGLDVEDLRRRRTAAAGRRAARDGD